MPPSSVGTARARNPASRRCSKDSCTHDPVGIVAGGVLGEHRSEAGRPGDELRLSCLGVLGLRQCRHADHCPELSTGELVEFLDSSQYEKWTPARSDAGYACRCMPDYGKFCPVSMGAEVVADRWTPLILRELILGSTRFNDIARGLAGDLPVAAGATAQASRTQGRPRAVADAPPAAAASTT